MIKENYTVQPIKKEECKPWLLDKHYAHRLCPISYAFGLYRDKTLIGICTFGIPASHTLCEGICGIEYKDMVLEFNRLCCENSKNLASFLVGNALRLLPKPLIVVSFADTTQGHVGYIYQATNWIYTGLIQNHSKSIFINGKKSHSRTLICAKNNCTSMEDLKEKYGDYLTIGDYEKKHRYIYFLGSKKQIKAMKKVLKYSIQQYPKGESKRYDASKEVITQGILF